MGECRQQKHTQHAPSTKTECDYLNGWIKNVHIRKNSWGTHKKKIKLLSLLQYHYHHHILSSSLSSSSSSLLWVRWWLWWSWWCQFADYEVGVLYFITEYVDFHCVLVSYFYNRERRHSLCFGIIVNDRLCRIPLFSRFYIYRTEFVKHLCKVCCIVGTSLLTIKVLI